MSTQKLRPLLEAVQQNPEDLWGWMQLGNVAKMLDDWNTAFLAYLAASRLDYQNEETRRKFCEARDQHLASVPMNPGELRVEPFKLPYHTAVFLVIGILNFDTDSLQNAVKAAIGKGFKKIILDCTGLTYISGLGPSTLRNLAEYAEKSGGAMVLVRQRQDVREMLKLKGIVLAEYPDIHEAFQNL